MSEDSAELARRVMATLSARDAEALVALSDPGVEADTDVGCVLKFRRGKVVLFRPFREPAGALEAVGT